MREGDKDWRPASGLPARGVQRTFEKGNTAGEKYGAYSNSLEFGERAEQIVEELRPTLPLYHPADEPALALLGATMTRVERATRAINEVDAALGEKGLNAYLGANADRLDRLRQDLRGWIGTTVRLMQELGMTPASRARLGLDIALAERASERALDQLAVEGRAIRDRREGTGE
jgi:hypothetical protein